MAKKEPAATTPPSDGRIEPLNIADEMRESYLTYAMSVIVSRALPDVRDGLKPSQRRVLVAMHDLNLGATAKHRKCAKICGDTSGNYHPHGESVVYPTLVRMGQDFNTRYMLVDPQGNFGTIDGDPPAAMRYTEARMTRAATDMLEDLDKDTVDFIDNFEGTRKEPTVLPGKFPNLLCNGTAGIAVGMATSMAPHNVNEICDAITHVVDNPECSIDDLCKIVKGPDFPTGGVICGVKPIREAYKTGRSIVTVRGRVEIEQGDHGKTNLVITEIPYQVNKAALIDRIAGLVRAGSITGVNDINDYSKKDIRLVVEVKRGDDPNIVLNQLYKHTQLQQSFSIINIAIVEGRPHTLNLKQLCEAYRDHRKEVILRRTRWLLNKARARQHIVIGLLLALTKMDEIIKLIRASKDVNEAREKLMALKFPKKVKTEGGHTIEGNETLTRAQADAILAMTLSKLTGLERDKLEEEYAALLAEIADLMDILAREARVLGIIKDDLADVKKRHGDERRTEIQAAGAEEFDITDLIPDEQMVVTISAEGYIKRVPLEAYRRQRRGGMGSTGSKAKEGDYVEHFFIASTHDYLLVFTSLGKLLWLKVYDIPEFSKTAKGRALVNLLNISQVEKVSACIKVRNFDTGQKLLFVTAEGTVKKTELEEYSNVTKKGIRAIKLNEGDRLIDVLLTNGSDEIVLVTRNGYSIRFNETDARTMGRVAAGVRGIDLRKGDIVVGAAVVNRNASFLSICSKGYGKRSSFDDYRIQSRGGKGIINYKINDKTGHVVSAKSIFEGDEIMLMTRGGVVLRTAVTEDSLREIGRATQGVRMMRVEDGDEITSVVKIMNEEEAFEKADQAEAQAHVDKVIEKGIETYPGDKKGKEKAEEEEPETKPRKKKGKQAEEE
ncbi:MAG: DNA gyrase subunit A [Planctomycetes bacterium]|nr:DNA gyrase subunit A [Planctomycetota bacterium]MCB9934322.1 DNA gyrase subunit A [Planctomycetota bacterium]